MRILIDALAILPGVNAGAETYVQGLVHALGEMDPENEYLILVTAESRALFPTTPSNFSFRVLRMQNRFRALRVLYEQVWLPWLARSWKADVVMFPANIISIALTRLGIPSLVTIHDVAPAYYQRNFPGYMPAWKRALLLYLVGYAARHAAAVVTPSQFSRNEVCAHTAAEPSRVFVVYSGTPAVEVTCHAPESVLSRYGLRRPYVLTVAASNKHKNLERLIEAFVAARRQSLLAHQLVLAGPPGSAYGDVLRAIERAEAVGFVRVLGYVRQEDLPVLYSEADLMALPSLYEGFGFPVLEAMQLGVPTLLSNAGSLHELGGSAAYYVDPLDGTAIALALQRLLADAQLRHGLSQAGRTQAARFNWKNTAARMLELLQQASRECGRPQSQRTKTGKEPVLR